MSVYLKIYIHEWNKIHITWNSEKCEMYSYFEKLMMKHVLREGKQNYRKC
jgi:hypothetical protein